MKHHSTFVAIACAVVLVATSCQGEVTSSSPNETGLPPWDDKEENDLRPDDPNDPSDANDPNDPPGDPNDPNDTNDPNGDDPLVDLAPPPPPLTETGAPSSPLRRLTEEELNSTLRDLFAGIAVPHVAVSDGEDASNRGGYEGDVTRQTPCDLALEQLRVGALAVASAAIAQKQALLPRVPTADLADERAAGHEFIAAFGPRALRRPLEAREVTAYGALFDIAFDDAGFDVAVQIVISAFLQAPSFLYRAEVGGDAVADLDGVVELTPYEMASRLSYLLWTSMPDQELFDAAASNALSDPDDIEAQARRMLADPRAKDAVASFHRQWLDFDRVLSQERDAAAYPQWSASLAEAMRTEAFKMVEHAVFDGDGTVRALLTSTSTRVNGPLADLYGVARPANDWDLVQLPGEQRSGLLTQAAFLTSRSHAVHPSPVLRGVFILDRFLCMSPPPPSGEVNLTPPQSDPNIATTNRQRYAQHTFDSVCQDCHAGIDGIGMGLEHYDAIGAYRTLDNGLPVDASGTLAPLGEGDAFTGAPALMEMLADSAYVEECVARQWLMWAKGRGEDQIDWPHINEIASRFHQSGGDVRELLVAIVKSPTFRFLPQVSP